MRYTYFLLAFLLFSCGAEPTNISTAIDDDNEDVIETKKCDPTLEVNYQGLIQNSMRLGDFNGGQPLDEEKLRAKGYDFSGVDNEKEIIQHVFSSDMREFLIVRESKADHIIREITLITRDYLTDQCIGVGSSVSEFTNAYKEFEIGYDAGNDSFYLSTADLMGIKFNLLTTTYKGSMNDVSPRQKFKVEDFESNTKIANVSLSDF